LRSASTKIKTIPTILPLLERRKKKGELMVFTNGCFDLLHAGHIAYLEKARGLGNFLVVGLNSDRSVREIKGPHRPVLPQKQRALVLAALEAVDYVVLFNEPTPLSLILALKPNILVKGADWKEKEIVGRKEVYSWGGAVKRIPFLKGLSTSNIIERICSLNQE
jgi:D-beta-D-heptose 7-phosphate kinase/D-beta-D-heptose 1-phosphate adenosyltransferase